MGAANLAKIFKATLTGLYQGDGFVLQLTEELIEHPDFLPPPKK